MRSHWTDGRGKVLNVYSIKRGYVDNECCVILRLYSKDCHCAIVFQFVSEEKWPINHHFQIIFVRSFWKNVRSWPMTDRYFKPWCRVTFNKICISKSVHFWFVKQKNVEKIHFNSTSTVYVCAYIIWEQNWVKIVMVKAADFFW